MGGRAHFWPASSGSVTVLERPQRRKLDRSEPALVFVLQNINPVNGGPAISRAVMPPLALKVFKLETLNSLLAP